MQQKYTSLKYISLLLVLYILPLTIDTVDGMYEHVWLVYVLLVFLASHFLGIRVGIAAAAIAAISHVGWEFGEHFLYDPIYDHQNLLVIAIVDTALFIVAIGLAALAERATREEELRKSKEHQLQEATWELQDTLNSMADGLFSLDEHLRLVYVNQALNFFLPESVNLPIGQSIHEIEELQFSKDFVEGCENSLSSQQPVAFETKSDITGKWSEVRICPSHKGLTVIIRDISERIEANEALQSSKDIFAKGFSASPIPLAISKIDRGEFVEVNRSFEILTGYSREEVIGHTSDFLNVFLNGQSWLEFRQSITNRFPVNNSEVLYKTRSGEVRTGLFSFEPLRVGNEACILVACNDITDLKRIQADMARLDRLNMIGEMAAGLGHEIRNPLTTVRGFLQLLGGKQEFAAAKEQFDLMISELDRSNAIITEFLSLAKTKPTDLAPHNINELIRKIHPLILADAVSKDKVVRLDLGEIPSFMIDEKEIRQLILNLVRNGLEATKTSGVLIVRTYLDNNQVVLAVQDQGSGISKEILAKLGTPFFTTKDNGTGLGLAVSYKIAERHNAGIDCESGSHGTTFYVKFQLSQQAA